jgi:hypothetical protein
MPQSDVGMANSTEIVYRIFNMNSTVRVHSVCPPPPHTLSLLLSETFCGWLILGAVCHGFDAADLVLLKVAVGCLIC